METAKQKEFIELVLKGENVFLTGKAGTGEDLGCKKGNSRT